MFTLYICLAYLRIMAFFLYSLKVLRSSIGIFSPVNKSVDCFNVVTNITFSERRSIYNIFVLTRTYFIFSYEKFRLKRHTLILQMSQREELLIYILFSEFKESSYSSLTNTILDPSYNIQPRNIYTSTLGTKLLIIEESQ